MSSGTSSTTGPGRPDVATAKARRTSSGIRDRVSIRITSFTAGRRISSCRHSWVMFFQECSRWLSPTMATIGVPELSASTRPVTRLVAPGPSVASTRPDAAGDLGIGVGREHAGALVVDQVVIEAETARRIVEGKQLEAAHAEHRAGAVRKQHANQRLAAGDLHRAHVVFHRISSMVGCIRRVAASTSRCGVTRTWSSRLGA